MKDYSEKSHVSLATKICIVCGTEYESGELLLDKRLRASMHKHTVTGLGMCDEHQKLKDDGFTTLVECEPTTQNNIKPEDAKRTGNIAHIRNSVWENIFNVPLPPKGICFVEKGTIEKLQAMTGGGQSCQSRNFAERGLL